MIIKKSIKGERESIVIMGKISRDIEFPILGEGLERFILRTKEACMNSQKSNIQSRRTNEELFINI